MVFLTNHRFALATSFFVTIGILCFDQRAAAELILTFSPTSDGTGIILSAEGTVDVTGLPQFGSHGIPQITLQKDPKSELVQSVVFNAKSYTIGEFTPLFDALGPFLHLGDHSDPANQIGDPFGLIVTRDGVSRSAILVPREFTSGHISGAARIDGVSLGTVQPIEQQFVWGSSPDQRARVVVAPIPEPTTALLFGLGLAGMAARRSSWRDRAPARRNR